MDMAEMERDFNESYHEDKKKLLKRFEELGLSEEEIEEQLIGFKERYERNFKLGYLKGYLEQRAQNIMRITTAYVKKFPDISVEEAYQFAQEAIGE